MIGFFLGFLSFKLNFEFHQWNAQWLHQHFKTSHIGILRDKQISWVDEVGGNDDLMMMNVMSIYKWAIPLGEVKSQNGRVRGQMEWRMNGTALGV